MLEQQVVDGNFSNKIFFTDEAHFTVVGYVNKQNCNIWESEKPQVIEERPLHPDKVTVWCALWPENVIGPYFFENEDGTAVNVNSERYGHMISDLILPCIEEYDLENMWFQKDDATCYPIRTNMALLQETFPGRVISRVGDINWLPRSCDLTPLDLFCGATRKTVFM